MRGYTFTASCPRCAAELEHRSSVETSPDRGWCECWCAACLIVWRIDVCMTAVQDDSRLLTRDRAAEAEWIAAHRDCVMAAAS